MSGIISLKKTDKVKKVRISPTVKANTKNSFFFTDIQFQEGAEETEYSEHVSEMQRTKNPRVTFREYPLGMEIDSSSYLGYVGESLQITATYSERIKKECIVASLWYSDDESIVTVSQSGLAVIMSKGITKVHHVINYDDHGEVTLQCSCVVGTNELTSDFLQNVYDKLTAKDYYPKEVSEEEILNTLDDIAPAPIIKISVSDELDMENIAYKDSVGDITHGDLITLNIEESLSDDNFEFTENVTDEIF
jgi:hypothetical protein